MSQSQSQLNIQSSPAVDKVEVQEENSKLRHQLKKCLDDKLQLSKECKDLEEKCKQSSQSKNVVGFHQRLMTHNQSLQFRLGEQTKQLEAVQNELTETKHEVTHSKGELADAHQSTLVRHEMEIANLKKENAILKKENASLKKENASFKRQLDESTKESLQKHAKSDQRIAELEKENAELRKENAELRKVQAYMLNTLATLTQKMAKLEKEADERKSKQTIGELGFHLDSVMRVQVFGDRSDEKRRVTFNSVYSGNEQLSDDEKSRFAEFVTCLESSVASADRCADLIYRFKEDRYSLAHLDNASFAKLTQEDITQAAKIAGHGDNVTSYAENLLAFILKHL